MVVRFGSSLRREITEERMMGMSEANGTSPGFFIYKQRFPDIDSIKPLQLNHLYSCLENFRVLSNYIIIFVIFKLANFSDFSLYSFKLMVDIKEPGLIKIEDFCIH